MVLTSTVILQRNTGQRNTGQRNEVHRDEVQRNEQLTNGVATLLPARCLLKGPDLVDVAIGQQQFHLVGSATHFQNAAANFFV